MLSTFTHSLRAPLAFLLTSGLVASVSAQDGEVPAPKADEAPAVKETPAEEKPAADDKPAEDKPAEDKPAESAETPAEEPASEPEAAASKEAATTTEETASAAGEEDGAAAAATAAAAAPAAAATAAAPAAGTAPPPLEGPAAAPSTAGTGPAPVEGQAPPQDAAAGSQTKGNGMGTGLLVGFFLDMSLPLGETAEFSDAFSAQGFAVDLKYIGWGNLNVGGMVAWHTIAEKSVQTVDWKAATMTGTMVTESAFTPMVGKVYYSLREPGADGAPRKFVPYAALGFGGNRLVRRLDVGISRVMQESWHWTFVPEVGIEVPLGAVSVLAAGRLNYLFKTGDAPEQLYMNFSVGVGLQ